MAAGLETSDGRSLDRVEVTVVYFVPRDMTPLPDWRDRVEYVCGRIARFHDRELDGRSRLVTTIHAEPFRSSRATGELRLGDATFTFFQTLGEVDRRLGFAEGERTAFPILLVLSDINWRDLEDFYRLRRTGGAPVFDGPVIDGRHVPGSPSGGARATYIPDRGVGWALVSADGWRVPYRGSDCVAYHEGVGHAIGLGHPQPLDGSVMSLGQYRGWLNESWLDERQKRQLGWQPPAEGSGRRDDLFSVFTAEPEPRVPAPDEDVVLRLRWPPGARVRTVGVAWQTELLGPWTERPVAAADEVVPLGRFAAPTPVGYRVRAELVDGQAVELWGYFQVRSAPDVPPTPAAPLREPAGPAGLGEAIDLLASIGLAERHVELPPGVRIELPHRPPDELIVTAIVTRLSEAGGLVLGLPRAEVALDDCVAFIVGRPVAIVCTVRAGSVAIECDGRTVTRPCTAHEQPMFLRADGGRYRIDALHLIPSSPP